MPATDKFELNTPGLTSPASIGFAITPDDATDLALVTRAIHVGGGGDIAVVFREGDGAGGFAAVTLKAVPSGSMLPIRVKQVMATGTTATDIVGVV